MLPNEGIKVVLRTTGVQLERDSSWGNSLLTNCGLNYL
jgi:hypothetical protein